mmetsp:Transcript_10601/g.31290  ORF Transcript_10601/g.31290 Transcript_10601/m.31290 type:complete len:552 (-) Transcript_10601:2-1657(-)
MKITHVIFAVHACFSLKAYARKEPLFRLRDASDVESETNLRDRERRDDFFAGRRFSEDTFESMEVSYLFRELGGVTMDFSMSMMTQAPSPTSAPTSSSYPDLLVGCAHFGSIEVPRSGYTTLKRGEFLCKDTNIPKNMVRFGVDETGLLGWWGIQIENGREAWEKLWDVEIDAASELLVLGNGYLGLQKEGEDGPQYVWARECTPTNGAYIGFDGDGPILRELTSEVDQGYPRIVWQLSGRNTPTETDFCCDGHPGVWIVCVSSSKLTPGTRLNVVNFLCDGRYKWGVASSGKVEHWYQLSSSHPNGHVMISSVGEEVEGNYLSVGSDGNIVQYDQNGVVLWETGCSYPGMQATVTIEGANGDPSTSFGTVTVRDKCGHELWESGRDYVRGRCDHRSTQSDYDDYDCRGECLFPDETLEQGAALCYADQAFGLGEGDGLGRLGQYEDGFQYFGLYRTPGGWDSGANGQRLIMQSSDGNMVLRDFSGDATWATDCFLSEGSTGKHILRKSQDIRGAEVYNSDSCEVAWRIFMATDDEGDLAMFESGCYPDRE